MSPKMLQDQQIDHGGDDWLFKYKGSLDSKCILRMDLAMKEAAWEGPTVL